MKKIICALALSMVLLSFYSCAKTQNVDKDDTNADSSIESTETKRTENFSQNLNHKHSDIDQYLARFNENIYAKYSDSELDEIEAYVRTLIPECIEQTDRFVDGFDNYFMEKYGHKYDFMSYTEIPNDIDGLKAIIPEAKPWAEYMSTGNGQKLFDFLYLLYMNDRYFFGGSNQYKSKANFYLNSIFLMSASGAPDVYQLLDTILLLRELGSLEKIREYYEQRSALERS